MFPRMYVCYRSYGVNLHLLLPFVTHLTTEWYKKHGEIVTVDLIKEVYNLPAETSVEYKRKAEFLLWYMDCFLPAAAGSSWGPLKRPYYLPTKKFELYGKDRILVETATEAFGWLIVQNCFDKWKMNFPLQKNDPDWKVPKYSKDDESTHPFHKTKFTEPTGGQGVGWKPEARVEFTNHKKAIMHFRVQDAKKGWKVLNLCKELIRQKHHITAPLPTPKGRKRKRAERAKASLAPESYLDMDDNSDQDFSVHSEGSAGDDDSVDD